MAEFVRITDQPPSSEPVTLDGLTRDAWIEARISDFASDPALRDRAIATILHDSLMLSQGVGKMQALVQTEGLGGIFKAMASELNPLKRVTNGR